MYVSYRLAQLFRYSSKYRLFREFESFNWKKFFSVSSRRPTSKTIFINSVRPTRIARKQKTMWKHYATPQSFFHSKTHKSPRPSTWLLRTKQGHLKYTYVYTNRADSVSAPLSYIRPCIGWLQQACSWKFTAFFLEWLFVGDESPFFPTNYYRKQFFGTKKFSYLCKSRWENITLETWS